jgi:hypothetical protein
MPDELSSSVAEQDATRQPFDQPVDYVKVVLDRLNSDDRWSEEKRESIIWLEQHASEVAANNAHVVDALSQLSKIALNNKNTVPQQNLAWKSAKAIWRASWDTGESRTTFLKRSVTGVWGSRRYLSRGVQAQHRAAFFGFLSILSNEEDGDANRSNITMQAAEELGTRAADIARYDEMVDQAVQVLIEKINSGESESVRKSACVNMGKILDAGWEFEENQESRRQAILDLVLDTLVTKGSRGRPAWFVRQASANWLGSRAEDIAADDRMLDKALDALIERANDKDENNDVRYSAREASKTIWEAGWTLEDDRDIRRPQVLEKVISALQEEDDDPQDWQFRQAAAAWLGDKAGDLAQNDGMARMALDALIERTKKDSDEYIRRSAERAIQENWDAGWVVGANLDGQRQIVLNQVLDTVEKEGGDAWSVRQVAATWLGANAGDIAGEEMMLTDALDVLLNQLRKEETLSASRSIREASEQLWDKGWASSDGAGSTNPFARRVRGAELATKETRHSVVFAYVVKSLESNDAELRVVATRWLDRHTNDIAENDRMVTGALIALLKRVNPVSEPEVEVRRAAREASIRIWNGAWKHGTTRQAVLDRVLKTLEEKSSGEEIRELKQSAINWLGDKERVEVFSANYPMAEQAAQVLVKIKRNDRGEENLSDSAVRSLMALWEQLRKRKEYKQDRLKAILEGHDEEVKDKTVRKLANESTLGARDNVNLLIDYWVQWIGEEKEPRLVELTADKLRENDHAVLPLVENFAASFGGSEKDKEKSAKRLRVRRRIARQLADMSDPRYFDDLERRESILLELREYAVPVMVQLLPEVQDVEILENMARMLAHTGEREAISALAKEVVGDSRERKARQELLATYYLKPSKDQNEQAASILEDAISQARSSLRLLRVLNALVVLIGLAVIVVGLYALFDDDTASRVPGLFAAFGGGTAVVLQFLRKPMIRIQNANSNLVQMETAFTSFIWELNLNGTFIQSTYVKDGELLDNEIDNTLWRIEEAMKSTMNLVSGYTKTGNQILVTRINKLEPAQHLLGDTTDKNARDGKPVISQAQKIMGGRETNGQGATGAARGARKKDRPAGNVALNHRPINMKDQQISWDTEQVTFKLPEGIESGTIWVSLYVDGMETNALPFQVIDQAAAEGAQNDKS